MINVTKFYKIVFIVFFVGFFVSGCFLNENVEQSQYILGSRIVQQAEMIDGVDLGLAD